MHSLTDLVGAGVLDEPVHQAVVGSQLLRPVAVVLVAGQRLGAVKPLGVGQVGVAFQKRTAQPVHRGRVRPRIKGRLTRWVCRMGVGGEVVVEGDVLRKDHHQVLARGGRRQRFRRRPQLRPRRRHVRTPRPPPRRKRSACKQRADGEDRAAR